MIGEFENPEETSGKQRKEGEVPLLSLWSVFGFRVSCLSSLLVVFTWQIPIVANSYLQTKFYLRLSGLG